MKKKQFFLLGFEGILKKIRGRVKKSVTWVKESKKKKKQKKNYKIGGKPNKDNPWERQKQQERNEKS